MYWARGLHICTYSFSNKYRDAVGIATDSKSFEYYMYKKILSITFLIKYECRTKVQLTILHNRILQKTKTTSKYTPSPLFHSFHQPQQSLIDLTLGSNQSSTTTAAQENTQAQPSCFRLDAVHEYFMTILCRYVISTQKPDKTQCQNLKICKAYFVISHFMKSLQKNKLAL